MTSFPTEPSRKYRFSIQGGPFGDAAALRKHVRLVEELGYDEFFTSDHIGSPGSSGRKGAMYVVDPFAPLSMVAEATTRLRIGPLVLNTEFYNPALLARTAATVDHLSGGRLVLGLGTGYAAAEHESIGAPIRSPGPRVSRFEEMLLVLRSLLDTGSVDHDGSYESIHLDDLGVTPAQPSVPFLIGGHGRRVVGLAGRHADVFQFTGLTHGDDGAPTAGGFAIDHLLQRSEWLSEAAGSRHDAIERSALVQFVACSDSAPRPPELADQFGVEESVIEETPFVLAGSLNQIVDKIERLRERLGITHYVVRDPQEFAAVADALTSP